MIVLGIYWTGPCLQGLVMEAKQDAPDAKAFFSAACLFRLATSMSCWGLTL